VGDFTTATSNKKHDCPLCAFWCISLHGRPNRAERANPSSSNGSAYDISLLL